MIEEKTFEEREEYLTKILKSEKNKKIILLYMLSSEVFFRTNERQIENFLLENEGSEIEKSSFYDNSSQLNPQQKYIAPTDNFCKTINCLLNLKLTAKKFR